MPVPVSCPISLRCLQEAEQRKRSGTEKAFVKRTQVFRLRVGSYATLCTGMWMRIIYVKVVAIELIAALAKAGLAYGSGKLDPQDVG